MSTRCRLDEKVATLAGKRIVVTGGATGIGFATARLAAERGATVVLMSRNESRLQSAVEAIGDDSSAHVVDVTDADAVARALDSIGPLDHLISSAAGLLQGPFRALSEKAVRSFFEVKFWGQYRTLRAALPYLAADGSAVLVSGFLYRKARPGLSPFAAANGAIEGLVKALALELAPIRVNAISPGQVDSWGGGGPIDPVTRASHHAAVAAELPVGRIGTPTEAAHAAMFLMENTFTTGITLDVDGGMR